MRSAQDVKAERCLAVNNQNFNSLTSNVFCLASEVEKVYPNPSERDVTIELETPRELIGHLYDVTGKIVQSFKTTEEISNYTIKGLAHGVYNLRLIDETMYFETKRIIIR